MKPLYSGIFIQYSDFIQCNHVLLSDFLLTESFFEIPESSCGKFIKWCHPSRRWLLEDNAPDTVTSLQAGCVFLVLRDLIRP